MIKYILMLMTLSSCAPMPGTTLCPWAKQEAPVRIIRNISLPDTSAICNNLLIKYGKYADVVAGCILNACIIPACYEMRGLADGTPIECEVWVMSEERLPHEERHCMGYDDVWY